MNEVFIILGLQLSIMFSLLVIAGIYLFVAFLTMVWAAIRLALNGYEYARTTLTAYPTPSLPTTHQHKLEPKI